MAILGLHPAAAWGARFVVDSPADLLDASAGDGACAARTGSCTLRAAIQEANALPGADVVDVPAGTYQLAIRPLNQNDITTGDLDITGSVAIKGAGAGTTIVDAGLPLPGSPPDVHGLDRLFEVALEGGEVSFSGLTIQDGYATEYGGAIANSGRARVTVSGSLLTRNVAKKAGGAIDNHADGAFEVRDSTLSGNFAYENGSAINNNRDGALTVTGTTITGNSAAAVGLDETLVGAGAISNNAELDTRGTITVTDSQITGNRAGGGRDGAGIANDGTGTVSVARTAFSGNGASADGGAIFNGGGTLTVDDSSFDANAAVEGGAIYANAGAGSATVRGSRFSHNTTTAGGGAVVNSGTGQLTLLDSTFTENTALEWGGAVLNDNKGGVAMERIAFHRNRALSGGGFANEGAGLVTVDDSTFTANTARPSALLAGGEGGGMHSSSGGEVVVSGGSFSANDALGGGGLSNEGGGSLAVTGTRFSGNSADEQGGGILIESGAVRMLDIEVLDNVSSSPVEGGGGISYAGDKAGVVGESAAIEDSVIRGNVAAGPGGGLDSRGDGPLVLTTTSVTGNTAAAGGAIHHVGDAPLDVTRSTLSGNGAQDGGGVLTDGDGEATIENSTVSGNRAAGFGGGLLVLSRLKARHATVTGNTAATGGGIDSGGGDLVGDGTVWLRNTIVAGNPTGANCAGTMTSLGGNVEDGDSCRLRVAGDQPGTNPLLGPLADYGGPTLTHALLAGSPAQDRAVCSELEPCPARDQRGVARPQFVGHDAGAYESQTAPGGGDEQPCAGVSERAVRADSDSWVSQSAPFSNFGADATLKVESKLAANDRALIGFTLPAVPPGCKLVGATLRLHSASATDGHTLQALRLASGWSEGAVAWANQPAAAGPAATAQSGVGTVEWDVLALARDMYAFGSHGFVIRDADENGSGEQSFHSREKGDDGPPELLLVFADPDGPPPPGDCPTSAQSVAADRDSWVSQGSPSNNFGSDSTLKVKSQPAANSRALLRFALPALPAGCSGVASASLHVEAASAKVGRTLEVRQVASAWAESSVTWSNQPGTTGPAATVPSADGSLEWNVTQQLRAMYASANHGFQIRDAAEDGFGDEQTLNSRDKLNDGPPALMIAFEDGAPETRMDAGPSGLTGDATPTFEFSSEQAARFECRTGGGAFAACSSPHTTAALPDGTHTFEVRAVDAAGNSDPTPARRTFTVDTTAPQTAIHVSPSGVTGDPTPTFQFSSELGAIFQCRVDGGTFTGCTSPHSTATLADGPHMFEVRAVDAAGNIDPSPSARAFTVDTGAPETTIEEGPSGLTADATPMFRFSSEPGASFRCRIDGAAFAECTSPHTTATLADGPHAFEVQAVDAAGNTDASPATRTFAIDTAAPDTAITEAPRAITNSTGARFEFSGEPGATFECSLDGAPFAACTSPRDYSDLAAGAHSFSVRAKDAAGNADATPAAYAWTVDTSAPETTIDDGPSGATADATPTFRFSSEPGASFQCRINNGPFAACGSPHTTHALADGSHTFDVRAIDAAGNSDPTPASRTFTVDTTVPDTTAPDTALTDKPPALTNSTSVRFAFSGSDEATPAELIRFECRIDDGAFSACTSPHTTATLTEGAHSFDVRAVDAAGNRDASPASHAWTVDTTAPATILNADPSGRTRDPTPTFAFSSEPGARFECRLGDGAFTACTSPHTTPALADGPHTFEVRAIDAAGNPGPVVTRAITVDTTAPDATITETPRAITDTTSARFAFVSEPGAAFECSIDGAAFAACSSPRDYAGLAAGPHRFSVRASDAAGNTDATPATYSWTIDTTPPDTTLNPGPSGLIADSTPTFTFTSEPGASLQCRVDDQPFAACTSPHTTAALADGAHTFEVRATDAAGNTGPTATRTVRVDTAAPATTIDSGPDALSGDRTPTFEFSSEQGARFECRTGTGAFSDCVSPHTVGPLADGTHTFAVRAIDAAGNAGAPAAYAWVIDTTVPDTTEPDTALTEQPPAVSGNSSASFGFSGSDDSTAAEQIRFECRLDSHASAGFAACESPELYSGLADGSHSFEVRAIDAAGNLDATPATYSWTIDTTPPETTIAPAPSGLIADSTPTFAFTSEPTASLQCRVDDAPFAACSSPHTIAPLADGQHTFDVRATDQAGNTGPVSSRTITIDTTPPDTTVPDTGAGGGGSPPPPAPTEPPPAPPEPAPIRAELNYQVKVRKAGTTLRNVRLANVPAGALVRVTCDGRSCPRKSLRITSQNGGVVKLKPFEDKRLRPRTTLTIRITKAGMANQVLVLKVRARRPPRLG